MMIEIINDDEFRYSNLSAARTCAAMKEGTICSVDFCGELASKFASQNTFYCERHARSEINMPYHECSRKN
jgi:hypothetical protein